MGSLLSIFDVPKDQNLFFDFFIGNAITFLL